MAWTRSSSRTRDFWSNNPLQGLGTSALEDVEGAYALAVGMCRLYLGYSGLGWDGMLDFTLALHVFHLHPPSVHHKYQDSGMLAGLGVTVQLNF